MHNTDASSVAPDQTAHHPRGLITVYTEAIRVIVTLIMILINTVWYDNSMLRECAR